LKRPLSLAIGDRLRGEIAAGVYPTGSRLPPEPELARRLDVSRSTLREALKLLEREGLVTRRQRAGTTVCARPTVRHPLQHNCGVRDVIEASGRRHAVVDARIRFDGTSEELAEALELAPGDPVVVFERTRTADGKPVVRTVDHLDSRIVERATAPLVPDVSLYRWLHDHCGIAVTYGVAQVAATLPASDVSEHLAIAGSDPVLTLVQVDYTAAGRPVLHSQEYHVAEAFHVTVIRNGPYTR
jgi:GntR family transcriptional regulator